jgi:hypothetical protein
MSVTRISTHLENAISRLLYQFQGKTGVEGLIGAQAKQIQEMEDAGIDFLTKMPLQTSSGAVLDRWGIVLNEQRLGESDSDFRSRLFFKISRNISNGTPEELISFFAELLQADNVQISEIYPGQVWMAATGGTNPASPVSVRNQLQQLAPSGVKIGLLVAGFNEHPFSFAGHPNPNARGFDTYPTQDIGGFFVSVFACESRNREKQKSRPASRHVLQP